MALRPVRNEARARAHSFTARLEVVVFAATLASALALAWVSLQSIRAVLREQLAADTQTMAAATHVTVDAWIASVVTEATRLAAIVEGDANLGTSLDGAQSRTIAGLVSTLSASDSISGVSVIDAEGKPRLVAGSEALTPEDVPNSDAIIKTVVRAIGSEADRRVVISMPIRSSDRDREPTTLHATLRKDWIERQLDALAGERALQITVSDQDGHPVASSPRTAGAASESPAAAVSEIDVFGVTWRVVVRSDAASAIARFAPLMRQTVLVQLAIAFVASLMALFASSSLMQPIRALSEAARRLRDGEEDVPLPELDRQDEVGVLTRTFAEMVRNAAEARIELDQRRHELEASHAEMLARNAELHQANEVLEQLAITDGLTRIHNHRFFQDQLTREVKRADRTGAPLALLVIDLDDFKRFNDEYGHETGDEVLQRVAEVLVEETRDADLVARYGGEEFVVLASDTDLEGAAALAEKLRLAVHLRPLELSSGGASPRVTVSIGVAQYSGDRSRLFRDADRALYEAKAAGKDCVVVAAPGDVPGKHDRGPTIRNT